LLSAGQLSGEVGRFLRDPYPRQQLASLALSLAGLAPTHDALGQRNVLVENQWKN
jgi:hypothetical protein